MWRTLSLLLVVSVGLPAASQPVSQEAKLTADDAEAFDGFGGSVSLSGERALVGASSDGVGGDGIGSVYVFVRSGSTWVQEAKLTADDAAPEDRFGRSVSLAGDRALIGAFGDDGVDDESGAAYVFVRSGSVWTQEAKLTAADAARGDLFGVSVSLSDEYALIGASRDDDGANNSGAAYVFSRSGGAWAQQAKLTASDPESFAQFGFAVSLSGDRALVGAIGNSEGGENSGAAYVFVRSDDDWSEEAKLTATQPAAEDQFGVSVSLSGDRALIGVRVAFTGIGSESAYVFVRSGSEWTQEAQLTSEDTSRRKDFGSSVSLSGNRAIVGAPSDNMGGGNSGSAYLFIRSESVWVQEAKFTATDVAFSDRFGGSVSLSDERALVGVAGDDDGGTNSGSAYVFSGIAPVAAEPGVTPTGLALSVAPNPTRGSAALTLRLPSAVEAHIAAYDVLGRRVALLHDGSLAAGTHTFALDATGLPAGVYVVRATAGASAVTGQLTLVR